MVICVLACSSSSGTVRAAKPDDAKILDNNAINTDIAEERDIVPQRLHFLISDKGIDRDIDTNMVQVSKSDGPLQFFRAKIFGIGRAPKAEPPR